MDDLRSLALNNGHVPVNVYADEETITEVSRRWPYVFKPENPEYYSAFGKAHLLPRYGSLAIGDIDITIFEQDHVVMKSLGYRFGDFAYSVDMADLNEDSLQALEGIKTWVVDGSGYKRERALTHATFERIFKWVERLKPEMTYISVLTTHMDYRTMCDELPAHIRPAYDGLVIET
jgi:phosphoribosyl 1,2-cyclic phosphate phosphodiesterase